MLLRLRCHATTLYYDYAIDIYAITLMLRPFAAERHDRPLPAAAERHCR